MSKKCIHDMIPQTCSFCKDLPKYKNQLTNSVKSPAGNQIKNDQINQFPGEKLKTLIPGVDQNNHVKEESFMKEKENCLIPECQEKDFCRGLCHPHYDDWRNGKIEHPKFGKYTTVKPQVKPVKNASKEVEKQEKAVQKIVSLDEKGELLREFRKRLHEALILGQALILLGKKESVEKEVTLFSQRFV